MKDRFVTNSDWLNIKTEMESFSPGIGSKSKPCTHFFRNGITEHLYGYSATEALGEKSIELLIDDLDLVVANNIVQHVMTGENWTANFLLSTKTEIFIVVATNTPFYDDAHSLIGIICALNDSWPYQETRPSFRCTENLDTSTEL
ncbi:uncharacterized protein LOC124936328 isoform X2 [Impatiens glandulifera]|uniref:uncharacterized protein LOC124936328 isoform X2 n=1 Tax=Impatiens glandulifera TaxID=253017 RepID=UPI001FB11635|nr:uncharacterized protein LOC124936328 isoform X2 [Impatiens glandulifera]XP_047332774.1 uncharacterized protein LOC124936328 isoform X2 [Impatiens glandulifera]